MTRQLETRSSTIFSRGMPVLQHDYCGRQETASQIGPLNVRFNSKLEGHETWTSKSSGSNTIKIKMGVTSRGAE